MKIDFDKIFSQMADYHVPFAMGVFGVGTVLQWYHHLDGQYIAFTTSVLSFLGAHAIWGNRDNTGG